MSLSRVHTFTDTVVSADDLNAEFDHILYRFGHITVGDTDLGAITPYPYVVGVTGTPVNEQVDAAVAAGKYLYLPAGDYTIDPCVLPAGARIVGAGIDRTTITADNVGATDFNLIGIGSSTEDAKDVYISDVTLRSESADGASRKLVNINTSHSKADNIVFKRVRFWMANLAGRYHAQMSGTVRTARIFFDMCVFEDGYGVFAGNAQTRVTFKRCQFLNPAIGILMATTPYDQDTNELVVEDCYTYLNAGHAYNEIDLVGCRCVYRRNMYDIGAVSSLDTIIRVIHVGVGSKLFEHNYIALSSETSPGYWLYADGNNIVTQFNIFEGKSFSTDGKAIYVGARTSGDESLEANYGDVFNFNGTLLRELSTFGGSGLTRRHAFPRFTKAASPYGHEHRMTPMNLGNLYITIVNSGTTNPNKLYFVNPNGDYESSYGYIDMVGTTNLLT